MGLSSGRGVRKISSGERSSSGNAPFAASSAYRRLIISCSRSGSWSARLCSSDRSTSVWYSSQVSLPKLPRPLTDAWVVTAFHPLCQIAREPSIE
jgi:hypothetical protein